MQIGLIGLPRAGKKTLMRLLTGVVRAFHDEAVFHLALPRARRFATMA